MDDQIDLSNDQINELTETFNLFDRDGDGFISTTELGKMMNALGENPTEAELQDMINEVDLKGNNTINLKDYLKMMERKIVVNDDEIDLMQAFKVFDQTNSGFITQQDLNHVMTNVFAKETFTDYEINAMIKEADADNDGKVSYEDFLNMMTSNVI